MTHLTETEAEKVGAGVSIPEDIFQTACGIVMQAKSLKSVLKHKDVVYAIATALMRERKTTFLDGYEIGFDASGEGWNGEYPGDFRDNNSWNAVRNGALEDFMSASPDPKVEG